jgi:TRAP-type C4-dicarboxylate transport system permease small subunit
MLDRIIAFFERLSVVFAYAGAVIVVVQMVWISYGVMMRYVFASPDGTVTEATALLLFPVAFLGLAFALKEDAYPKVSYLIEATQGRGRKLVLAVNYLVMLGVGVFFSVAAVRATFRSFHSGASSEILLWPRYLFWAPGAIALLLFTAYTACRLAALLRSEPARTE